jgi:hypothetical protein
MVYQDYDWSVSILHLLHFDQHLANTASILRAYQSTQRGHGPSTEQIWGPHPPSLHHSHPPPPPRSGPRPPLRLRTNPQTRTLRNQQRYALHDTMSFLLKLFANKLHMSLPNSSLPPIPTSLALAYFPIANPTFIQRFQPSGAPSSTSHSFLGMCIEAPQFVPHPRPQSHKWLLAWSGVHRVLREVVEEDAVDSDEADQAPLHDLDPLVPLRSHRLHLDASLELALKPELLLLSQGGELGRPFLSHAEAVAREVEGREGVLMPAEEALEEAQHRIEWRSRGSNR